MKRPQNWKKSPTFLQNNCFYSVALEQEGDFFFKFLWPSQKNWTLPDPGDDDQHASRYVNGDEIVGKLPLENQVDGKAAVFPCIHKTWKKIYQMTNQSNQFPLHHTLSYISPIFAFPVISFIHICYTLGRSYTLYKTSKTVDWIMDHCFWTEVSVCHSSLCGLALAILVLWYK